MNFSSQSERGIFKPDFQIVTDILPAPRPIAAATAGVAEYISETEKFAQYVTDIEARRVKPTGSLHPLMPKTVICGALGGIAQYSVGFGSLFESLFRCVIAGIAVWMVLERQLSIGTLDLLVIGLSGDAEDLVVVAFGHGHGSALRRLHGNFHHGRP